MDIESLAKELILKNMNPEQQLAVLEGIKASVAQAKEVQKQRIGENVGLVVDALKKIESDIRSRFDEVGNVIEKRVATIKDGKDGKDGRDGRNGKDGRDGKQGVQGVKGEDGRDGRDGVDGIDGVSVTSARIDFDGSLVISLSSGVELNVGEVVAPDLAESIKVITNGGGTSQSVIDTLASLQTQITNLIPSQTGNSGKYLTTNGTALSWASVAGGLTYQGTWNASTNTPTLTSSVGTNGYYYIVATAGSTNLNGITDWQIGDWLMFNGTVWQKIDQSNLVTSVNGQTGAVSVGTVTSVSALTLGTTGTDLSSTVATSTTTPVITLNVPTASATNRGALSSADWTTFNNKGSGTVTSVSGTTGRITSTGGTTPVIDLTSGVATAGTTGSASLIPVITIDTYGRVTSITTAANPQGTVTSVTGTSPVASSGGATPAISLASGYGDTLNPYASKTANYVLAAPNGSAGVPTFRAVVAADIPTLNQSTTGSAATLTTTRAIYGNNFDGSAALTQVIASTYGGTGNGFSKFTGPLTAEKTFTLPNASATILTDNAAVTVLQGGTGATTASGARTNLGLVIGTDVLAPTGSAASLTSFPTFNQNTTGTASNVTGTVAIANGGTGQTTASAGFNALSPVTSTGDLILGNGINSATRLAIGTTGYVLTSNGTTASWAAANGGALSWQTVQTANFAASSGSAYPVNTTSGSKTVTLPASPSAGNSIAFVDYAGTWGTNGLVVNPNGNKLNGSGLNSTFGTNREGFILVYIDATQGWLAYAGFNTVNPTQSFNLDLLIVAGGGGGGADSTFGGGGWKGGAGGAGGYLEQSTRVVSAGAYTVTVGSGGVAGSSAGASGGTGNTSVFSTSTALGGGAGAGSAGNNTSAGNPGGSGGGGSGGLSGSSSGGSATQGNSGGATGYGFAGGGSGYAVAGGGGGAGGAGTGSVSSGGGGTGRTSAITSITYAAGGAVAGGVAGTANRGNGGSGGAGNGAVGYAGGSGVVVFKYTSSVTATYSGGVTRTTSTSGGFTTDTITATSTTSETVTFS